MNKIIREDLDRICSGGLDWQKFQNCTFLVAGAYGMLPSYMVFTLAYLNEKYPDINIKIVALGRSLEKAQKRFADFLEKSWFSVLCQDVSREIKVDSPVDYIIHAASPANSQSYETDPVGVILPNVFGTKNLLELAREKKSKGFLFLSSGEVCGEVAKEKISENDSGFLDPTMVRNCYGESKRMGEAICVCWHKQFGVPTFSVRPEHTYGPTIDLENDKRVFSEFVSDVIKGRNITMKSDGTAVRIFCYISDATEGFFRVLLNGTPGESYNVGNMQGRMSIGTLAQMLAGLYPEKKMEVVYENSQNADNSKNTSRIRPILSTEKMEKIGYYPRISPEEGFQRTIKSFIDN